MKVLERESLLGKEVVFVRVILGGRAVEERVEVLGVVVLEVEGVVAVVEAELFEEIEEEERRKRSLKPILNLI